FARLAALPRPALTFSEKPLTKPLHLLLRGGSGDAGESAADAVARPGVHRPPLPGQPSPDAVADRARGGSQPQAGPTTPAAHGSGGGLPQTPAEYRPAGAPDLPVLAAEREHRAARSGLEYGHHVCAAGLGLHVPGSHPRLVQPLRPGVAAVENAGRSLLPGNA